MNDKDIYLYCLITIQLFKIPLFSLCINLMLPDIFSTPFKVSVKLVHTVEEVGMIPWLQL